MASSKKLHPQVVLWFTVKLEKYRPLLAVDFYLEAAEPSLAGEGFGTGLRVQRLQVFSLSEFRRCIYTGTYIGSCVHVYICIYIYRDICQP